MNKNTVEEGKTIAIIGYFYVIGLIIAFVMNNEKKNEFAAFHFRQSLGLSITTLLLGAVSLNWFIASFVGAILFILWIIALFSAIQGQTKPIPYIGVYFQEWFAKIP